MAREARRVLPTDLLALVTYQGRSYRNEAWTRERLGADESQRPLGLVLDKFLAFSRGRSAWISVRRQRLQGLVGARRRGGRAAWEIDYLVDATPGHETVVGLLECAIAEVGRAGAEKLFLRLDADCDLLPVVLEAGFLAYQEEVLYCGQSGNRAVGQSATTDSIPMRPVLPSDSYLLFRLYSATTPEATRRAEAATFGEWHAAQERRWLKNGVQLLREEDGQVRAAARAARLPQGVAVELALDEAALDETAAIVAAAAGAVEGGDCPVFVLVPRTAAGVALRLEEAGFEARQEFVCLMRRTTRPQKLLKLQPAIARNAVGA